MNSRPWRIVVIIDGKPYAQCEISANRRAYWLRFAREDPRTVHVWEESQVSAHMLNGYR